MTETLRWLSWAVAIVLTLATLPGTALLTLYTIAALAFPRRRMKTSNRGIRLCALIPAHDEEVLIGRCVRSLLVSGGAGFGVYVVADNCSDSTAIAAAAAGAQVLVRTDPLSRGKGYALDFGFEKVLADGADCVLVVDADSVVSPNLVDIVRQYVGAGATAVQCRYRVAGVPANVRSELMDLALLGFNVIRPRGRDRLGLSAGILGNGFALTAAVLRSVPYRACSIVEDLEYHVHLVRAGYRVRFADETTVYGEMPAGAAASSQRSRWEGGRLRMLREWLPRLAVDVSRGRARSVELLMELVTLPLAYQTFLLVVLFAMAPGPYKWWAAVQLTVITCHIAAAASLGDNFPSYLRALAAAPFYIVWKLALLRGIIRSSRPGMRWIRTSRDN